MEDIANEIILRIMTIRQNIKKEFEDKNDSFILGYVLSDLDNIIADYDYRIKENLEMAQIIENEDIKIEEKQILRQKNVSKEEKQKPIQNIIHEKKNLRIKERIQALKNNVVANWDNTSISFPILIDGDLVEKEPLKKDEPIERKEIHLEKPQWQTIKIKREEPIIKENRQIDEDFAKFDEILKLEK